MDYEVDFLHVDKLESFLQIDNFWWWLWSILKVSKIASLQSLHNILKKEVRDEVEFLHSGKHESFLQVDLRTLGIKISFKVLLSLLMCMIKLSQSTQI